MAFFLILRIKIQLEAKIRCQNAELGISTMMKKKHSFRGHQALFPASCLASLSLKSRPVSRAYLS